MSNPRSPVHPLFLSLSLLVVVRFRRAETARRGRLSTMAPLPLTTECENARLRGLLACSLSLSLPFILALPLLLSFSLSLPADRSGAKKKMRSERGRRGTTQTRRMSSCLRSFHSLALLNAMCVRSSVRPYVCMHSCTASSLYVPM